MDAFIVGTAGHIDHGKTSLVRALTGVDTDRLEEERRRGITIELGFAPLRLPSGAVGGVVDVPGHERFVRTMIAGATGIDLAILVVAADEGLMPQTREHLDILQVLAVPRLLVALTKSDLVDEDLLGLAAEEVQAALAPTPFTGAPILPCSSVTREGLDTLLHHLQDEVDRLPRRRADGPFRLPVDRTFSMRGFGTVVTGTSISGRISSGDEVEILPSRLRCRVRGIQVHGQSVASATPSHRVALNLQGVSTEQAPRGSLVATPGAVAVTTMVDVTLHLLASAPHALANRSRVRFLAGTAEALGVVQLIGGAGGRDETEVPAGWTGPAQVRLDAPLPLRPGDHFVIREPSPLATLGGGVVLDPQPRRYRPRDRVAHLGWLQTLAGAPTTERAVLGLLERQAPQPVSVQSASVRLGLDLHAVRAAIDVLVASGAALPLEGGSAVAAAAARDLLPAALDRLRDFHQAEPLLPGMPKNHLRTRLPGTLDARLFQALCHAWEAAGAVEADDATVRVAGHRPRLAPDDLALLAGLESRYREARWDPPDTSAVLTAVGDAPGAPALLLHLQREGKLLRVKEDVLIHRDAWAALVEAVRAHLAAHGEMDPVAFKELAGLSRRLAIPLLEMMDRQKVTVRVGNLRRWRGEHRS